MRFKVGDTVLYTPNAANLQESRPWDVGRVKGYRGGYVLFEFINQGGCVHRILEEAVSFMPGSREEVRDRFSAQILPQMLQHSEKRMARIVWGQHTVMAFEHSPLDTINAFLEGLGRPRQPPAR
jgi:hypothetical protein